LQRAQQALVVIQRSFVLILIVTAVAIAGTLLVARKRMRAAFTLLLASAATFVVARALVKKVLDEVPSVARTPAGEAALAAQLWGEARRHLTLAAEASPATPSRRLCLLMARLEESENGEPKAAREWLDRAIGATLDPCYVCGRCGTAAPEWRSLCAACGGFDTLAWRAPEAQGAIGVYSSTGTAPLMLPAVDAPDPVVSAQSPEPLGSGRAMG